MSTQRLIAFLLAEDAPDLTGRENLYSNRSIP